MIRLIFAFRDIKKNIRSVLFFSLQIGVLVVLITVIASNIGSYINYYVQLTKLDKYSLTMFDTYYRDSVLNTEFGNIDSSESDSQETLEEYLLENKGFSYIDGVKITKNKNIDLIIGIGAFASTYSYGKNNQTSMLIGSKVSNFGVGDTVIVGEEKNKYTIGGILPENSSFFMKSALMNLDDKVLLLMSYEEFNNEIFKYMSSKDREFYSMIIQTNFKAIDSNENDILKITDEINNSNLIKVVPKNYNDLLFNQNNMMKSNITFFLIIVLAAIIFMGIGLTYNLLSVVDNNMQEYTISLIYGETMKGLYIRAFIYVLFIIGPPTLFAFTFLNFTGIVGKVSLVSQSSLILILSVIISIIPIRRIDINNIVLYLRRDV